MPLYTFLCDQGCSFDRYLKLDNYNDPQVCECGADAKRQLTPTMISVVEVRYESPVDGAPITTKKKRLEDLARNGCIEYEPGMRQDADRKVVETERKLEKEVDNTVDRLIQEMPSRKKEKLDQELNSGAVIEYTRGVADE